MIEEQKQEEQDMESLMGTLLRVGVIISASIVIIGGILYLVQHGAARPHYQTFKGEPSYLKGVREIFDGAVKLRSRAVIQLGILILIATPVARVIFSVYGFLKERDFLYVGITLAVLAIIALSLFSGIAG